MKTELKVGVGRVEVTPPLGSLLVGYGSRERLAESVRDPLNVTAMVLQRGERRVAIIGLDWCTIHQNVVALMRQEIHEHTPILPHDITICCSQTHSGSA